MDQDNPNHVYKLNKALYGLKQAPRAWYDMLSSFLISQDFSKGSVDPTLFIRRNDNGLLLVQIYVDDIIFVASTLELCDLFSKQMCSKFKMSMMGKILFFLGLRISQSPKGIFINQFKYALESLKKYSFESCDPVDTPMVEKSKLDEDKEGKVVDSSHYREVQKLLKHAKRWLAIISDSNPVFILKESIRTMDLTIDQQVALDEALTPFFKAFLVTTDVLEIYMQEFWATATVHHHSIRFKMDNKKHIVNLEYFREMLHMCPRLPGQTFDEPPFEEEILAFLQFLGHSGEIRRLTDGFYHKRNVDFTYLLWEDFIYQVEHKDTKKRNEMYYPRFTKVIIRYFMSKDHSIPRRNKVNWHYVRDDQMFTMIKLSSSDTTVTPPPTAAAGTRLFTFAKGKQSTTTSKAKSLTALLEVAMTEVEHLKLATKRSLQQTHISQASGYGADKGTYTIPGSDEQDDDDARDDDDDQGEEETRDEESFDPILKTPKNTNDKGNGEENLGLNVGREEGQDEEDDEDKLYRDVNINLEGRGVQMANVYTTQEFEDSHVTLTLVNPDGQQQITLKRCRDDADKHEELSAGSDRGSKRRREGKEPESASAQKEKATKSTGKYTQGTKSRQTSASESATAEEPMQTTHEIEEPSHPEFETGDDDQPIVEPSQHPKWFSQQKKPPTLYHDWNKIFLATHRSIQPWISKLAKQTDSHSSFNELMDTPVDFSAFLLNRLKVDTLTPELSLQGNDISTRLGYPEGQQYPHNLLKPLPLIPNSRSRRVIPFDHFIDNDLEYLRGGYDKHAQWEISHWGANVNSFTDLLSIRSLLVMSTLNVESSLSLNSRLSSGTITSTWIRSWCVKTMTSYTSSRKKKLNLTRPDTYRSDLKRKEAYIAYSNPRGFIYQNKDKQNRLMRIDELHKFSDGMLTDVRTALDDHLKGIRIKYLPQTIWRKSDKESATAMIQAIDKQLKTKIS
nr:copia protein [Tanacetum cinerariifolium]